MKRSFLFTCVLLLVVVIPAQAAQLRARYTTPGADVATMALLGDTTVIVADTLAVDVACGSDWCVTFPLGARGATITYTLRACNSLGECAVSNGVSFRVPLVPTAPVLSIEIVP